MIVSANKRVSSIPAVTNFRAANYYASAAGAGPAGQSTMTWVSVLTVRRIVSTLLYEYFWNRCTYAGTSGWGHAIAPTPSQNLIAFVTDGGGVWRSTSPLTLSAGLVGRPIVLVSTLAGGVLSAYCTGASAVTTQAVVGYTAAIASRSTAVGIAPDAGGSSASPNTLFGEGGMLHGYDGTGFASSVFGNGLPGLVAMWSEDLQQGRYLTWPRAAVASSDWYWSARDVVDGPVSSATWTDRITGVAMTRSGAPQSASAPARFAQ